MLFWETGVTAAAAVAESFLTLCFVVLEPGFSKDRGENALRDVGPFHSSPSCAQWSSITFWGCFCSLPLCQLAVSTTVFLCNLFTSTSSPLFSGLPLSFPALSQLHFYPRVYPGTSEPLKCLGCTSAFPVLTVSPLETGAVVLKCPAPPRPPLCLKRKVRLWREDVPRINS